MIHTMSGPIILGTVVLEKLGMVKFDSDMAESDGEILLLGKDVEKSILEETYSFPLCMKLVPCDYTLT